MSERTSNLDRSLAGCEPRHWMSARGLTGFVVCLCVLGLLYSKTLLAVMSLALASDLNSHILLIPFVSLYLVWLKRAELPQAQADGTGVAAGFFSVGLLLALGGTAARHSGYLQAHEDFLCLMVLSFVLLLAANGLFFFGRNLMGSIAFPFVLLLFLAPMPKTVELSLETFFQHTSAEAAAALFGLAGTPVVRNDSVFRLPGLIIQVAPECSGIRSSFVLFITSLLAGHLFLRTPWKRAALTLFVIPLGILRNGFRIFTLGLLCVYVDKRMIDSWVHHKGGPLFFVLSLVPFFLVLLWLRKSEARRAQCHPSAERPEQVNHTR